MSKYGTNFLESEALLAVQADDEREAERILREMLPGELAELAAAAGYLREMARSMHRIKCRTFATGSDHPAT